MINDSRTLPPQFMFILVGCLFVIGAILMNFIRVWANNELNVGVSIKKNCVEESDMEHLSDEMDILVNDDTSKVTSDNDDDD